jgi:hypothetical protein
MYDKELADCQRRIALGNSLNTLLNHNPDFRKVIVEGFMRDEVLAQSLNINNNKPATIQFLRGVNTLKTFLDRVAADAEQAQVDLMNYQQLLQDGR